nr:hypothetical protein [Halobacillus sp. Marseille-P3879]
MDVAEGVHEVITVHNKFGMIPALKKMAVVVVLFVKEFGVIKMKQMKNLTRGKLCGFKQQVNVIAHEAVSVKLKWVFFVHEFEDVKIPYAVVVMEKDIFLSISS